MGRRRLTGPPLVEALLNGDVGAVHRLVMMALADSGSRVGLVADHLQPSLHALRDLWYQGAVRSSDERQAAEIIGAVLEQIGPTPSAQPVAPGSRFLLGSLQGEEHSLGMRILGMVLEDQGWEVAVLESRRAADLAEAARVFSPQVVGISCGYLPDVHQLTSAVSELKGGRYRVMVGGPAINRAPGLPVRVGADATGIDARVAVVVAGRQLDRWRRQLALQERLSSPGSHRPRAAREGSPARVG